MTQEVAVRTTSLANGLGLLAELEHQGAITEVGVNLEVFDATFDQCEAIIALCRKVRDVSSWLIGDLLVYGENRFGETYAQLEAATGYSQSTLQNVVYVARAVPHERRRPELSPAHHGEVAKLPPREQAEWLDRAVQRDWGRDDLRAHLRADEAMPEPECCPTCGRAL